MNDVENGHSAEALELEVNKEEMLNRLCKKFYWCRSLKKITSVIRFSKHVA